MAPQKQKSHSVLALKFKRGYNGDWNGTGWGKALTKTGGPWPSPPPPLLPTPPFFFTSGQGKQKRKASLSAYCSLAREESRRASVCAEEGQIGENWRRKDRTMDRGCRLAVGGCACSCVRGSGQVRCTCDCLQKLTLGAHGSSTRNARNG